MSTFCIEVNSTKKARALQLQGSSLHLSFQKRWNFSLDVRVHVLNRTLEDAFRHWHKPNRFSQHDHPTTLHTLVRHLVSVIMTNERSLEAAPFTPKLRILLSVLRR